MNRDAKIYAAVIIPVVVLFIASSVIGVSGLNDLFVVSAVLGVIGVVGKFLKDKKIAQRIQDYNQASKGGGINYSTDDCKDIAKDWAKNNFSGKIKSKKGISFPWTHSSTDPAHIYDVPNEEWIHIRYFYSPKGPKNKGILVFVDATNGEHYASRPVDKKGMKDNPFEYLEAYKQTKKFGHRLANRHHTGDSGRREVVPGIPLNSNWNQEGKGGEE